MRLLAALTLVGLLGLWACTRHDRRQFHEDMREAAAGIKKGAQEAKEEIRDAARNLRDETRKLRDRVREKARDRHRHEERMN